MSALGARVVARAPLQRWRYFPHFSSADIAEGCLGELERLQGRRQTWYAGETVSNIGVEAAASHAAELVKHAFPLS
jgi:hypothetical protein